MSKLAAWLEETGTKRNAFAEMLGVSPSYVTQLCQGTLWPGRDVAGRIAEATKGAVTAADFTEPPASRETAGAAA